MTEIRRFPRATEADPYALALAVSPLIPAARGFAVLGFDGTSQLISADFTGVNLSAVQAAVNACAQRSATTDTSYEIDNLSGAVRALALACNDRFNRLEQAVVPAIATSTAAQWRTYIKGRI